MCRRNVSELLRLCGSVKMDKSGMTLTEVIVSMTLITMMMTMLSTILMTGIRCHQRIVTSSEMSVVSEIILFQVSNEAEQYGMSLDTGKWIGMTVHEDYRIEVLQLSQEFAEYPELIRIDLILCHKQSGALHRSFQYVGNDDARALEESEVPLINDLSVRE